MMLALINIPLRLFFSFLLFLTCSRADFYHLFDDQTSPGEDTIENGTNVILATSEIQCALRCSRLNTICQTFIYDERNKKCILQTGSLPKGPVGGYETWTRLKTAHDLLEPSATALPEEKSCDELWQKYPSLSSQQYNINFNGTEIFVYCDMTQGGWTQIANIQYVNQQSFSLSSIRVDTAGELSDRLLDGMNYALSAEGLQNFIKSTGANQLRVYCSKPTTGRTFHIKTRSDTVGKEVLKYFSNTAATVLPEGVDSFDTFPDDNSYLSSHVHEWRFGSAKWGHGQTKTLPLKLYKALSYVSDTQTQVYLYKVGLNSTPKMYCDDDGTANSGVWKYFIR